MFRLFLSVLAAFVIVRVLVGLFRAIGEGLSDGGHESVRDGRGAPGSPSGSGRAAAAGDASAPRPPIDRDSAIDVPYTEIEAEEAPDSGRERRAG
jgi:hypothetical protein